MEVVGGYAIQALADFLIGEHCHACGRRADEFRSLAPPFDRAAAALTLPVRIGGRFAGVDTQPLCGACCHRLVPIGAPVCIGTVRRDGSISLHSGGVLPPIPSLAPSAERDLRVWPGFETDERLLAVVHALKFARRERLAPWLARALALGLPAAALRGDDTACIVAVPADAASRRRRGFNQAESLARAFAENVGVTYLSGVLVKTRATLPQSLLDGPARAGNISGAFAVAAHARVGGLVVLVDDLVTTGATAAACAVALYAAGAREVRIACAGYRP